jgi:hypothetical protein
MARPVRRPVAVEIENDVGNENDVAPAGGPILSGAVARAILGDGRVLAQIPPPTPLKRVRIRLADRHDVAKQLKKLFAMAMSGEITAMEATRRAKVLQSLADVTTSASPGRRLASIEKAIHGRGSRKCWSAAPPRA